MISLRASIEDLEDIIKKSETGEQILVICEDKKLYKEIQSSGIKNIKIIRGW